MSVTTHCTKQTEYRSWAVGGSPFGGMREVMTISFPQQKNQAIEDKDWVVQDISRS